MARLQVMMSVKNTEGESSFPTQEKHCQIECHHLLVCLCIIIGSVVKGSFWCLFLFRQSLNPKAPKQQQPNAPTTTTSRIHCSIGAVCVPNDDSPQVSW